MRAHGRDGPRVVVLGGGLAGAATAWALARRGGRVTLVEQEERPGLHASGRNAGLIRRVVADPVIAQLAREGAAMLAEPPEDLAEAAGGPLVRRTGSFLVAGPEGAPALRRAACLARTSGTAVRFRRPERVELLGLSAPAGATCVACPEDGVADPHQVLSALLDAAQTQGAEVRCGTPARIRVRPSGVSGVELEDAHLPAEVVVNAAGPWAAELVQDAGGSALPLVSYRRHLFYTGPLAQVPPDAAWVWDVERGFYLRPESAGLLLCACDADPRPPEDARPDEAMRERLAEKVAALAPGLVDHPVARSWAGLRCFAPDERFVIGWDPVLRGLFWVAALGGHGLTACCAVGELAADGVGGASHARLRELDPARFRNSARAG